MRSRPPRATWNDYGAGPQRVERAPAPPGCPSLEHDSNHPLFLAVAGDRPSAWPFDRPRGARLSAIPAEGAHIVTRPSAPQACPQRSGKRPMGPQPVTKPALALISSSRRGGVQAHDHRFGQSPLRPFVILPSLSEPPARPRRSGSCGSRPATWGKRMALHRKAHVEAVVVQGLRGNRRHWWQGRLG